MYIVSGYENEKVRCNISGASENLTQLIAIFNTLKDPAG